MEELHQNILDLRALSTVDLECPECQGEGCVLSVGRPGEYSRHELTFFPSEGFTECPGCDGGGLVAGCAHCSEPLVVSGGREVCGCSEAELARAA